MALSCNCPLDVTLPDVLIPECLSNFGQVNKVIFQRLLNNNSPNSIPVAQATDLDAWNVFFAAVDSTRMVLTPYIYNPTFTAGAQRTFGGGNATPGGRVEVIGAEATTFTSTINNMAQLDVIKPLKALMCEPKLGVYLINEVGKIAGVVKNGNLQPIPIADRTLFVGDWAPGGFEGPDTNALNWSFAANWSDNVEVITPEFDPLSDFDNLVMWEDPAIGFVQKADGSKMIFTMETAPWIDAVTGVWMPPEEENDDWFAFLAAVDTPNSRVRVPEGITKLMPSAGGEGPWGWEGVIAEGPCREIIFPTTLDELGKEALNYYVGKRDLLQVVKFMGLIPPTLHADVFNRDLATGNLEIRVPAAALQAYKTAFGGIPNDEVVGYWASFIKPM